MTTDERELELEDERVTERRYAEKLRENEQKQPHPFHFSDGVAPGPYGSVGRLVGRVALRSPDAMLGQRPDYYIGEGKHANVDGVEVYNWSNPIACTFYRKNHHHESYGDLGEVCADVVVIRSFSHANGQIFNFADDILVSNPPPHPFPKRELKIQPSQRPRPSRPLPSPTPTPTDVTPPNPAQADESIVVDDDRVYRNPVAEGEGIRAESLLREQLRAPRAKGLGPVLSTLQSEQYELVTVPAMETMVIEGQPGTGKTIIASHRAAYMINDQTPPENSLDGRVLIVGPTPQYSRHIRDVIGRLADDRERVIVLSMPELMQQILGTKVEPQGPATNTSLDVDWELGRFSGAVIARHRVADGVTPTSEVVYECLRSNSAKGRPLTTETGWALYLRQLPPYTEALKARAHWPLLAFISWEVNRPLELRNVEHIIVDEAQDVTELEWFLLQALNEADAWTILGDLNQRRSDHTHGSWAEILEILAVDPGTPIRRLTRGYRSTKPILDYANRLLKKKDRIVDAFQEGGVKPNIVSTRPKDVGRAVVTEIERLAANYPTGTVAAITVEPVRVQKALRGAGWAAVSNDLQRWQKSGAEVTVAKPDSARGLEFDAVVVVEPADFPTNYNRHGPLYTALTRGNRELAVVHCKAMPDPLRRRQ